ncbi:hypothetical protein DMB44_05385 [Thermoplasma sp. Kam2015]|uniref:hypothetical protein n=1 Tax=Thermoplasma sp. Kam2015 TaxID=2094122 RepID=UPI000D870A45|nr:hypothetical protein [Thermoplasma sp. Kam2015]PYB68154.1 hypothetical protein DMB44_05385 [Thermoplasma sp. Kam2015]
MVLAVFMLLAVPPAAAVQTASPYSSSYSVTVSLPSPIYAGSQISISVATDLPGASSFTLYVNGSEVASAQGSSPASIPYTFPSEGSYSVYVIAKNSTVAISSPIMAISVQPPKTSSGGFFGWLASAGAAIENIFTDPSSIVSDFSSLVSGIENAMGSFGNDVIGQVVATLEGFVLSAFTFLSGVITQVFNGMAVSVADLADNAGLFGPIIAMLVILVIFLGIYTLFKLGVDLL